MGSISDENGLAITVDVLGNTYTAGYFQGTVDFDPSIVVSNLTSVGGRDIFVQKLDSNGNFIWAKGMGGAFVVITSKLHHQTLP